MQTPIGRILLAVLPLALSLGGCGKSAPSGAPAVHRATTHAPRVAAAAPTPPEESAQATPNGAAQPPPAAPHAPRSQRAPRGGAAPSKPAGSGAKKAKRAVPRAANPRDELASAAASVALQPASVAAPGPIAGAQGAAGAQDVAVPAKTLDLASLEQRLRDTHSIGLFTKLSLKNQVDDLLANFRAFYGGRGAASMVDLHQQYDLLLLKVLSLLQNADPPLAADIAASRDAIWGILADPKKFAKL